MRVTWDDVGTRYFETGVDRGMLYLDPSRGVAWSGITSVDEKTTGGDPQPYYLDGQKYANVASSEEYEATLNAFGAPPEFAACDGFSSVANGLIATQQPRRAFSFSYRTRIGNDTSGTSLGYKIHIVYNALAKPAGRTYKTLGDSTDPMEMSWDLTTLPPSLTGYKPTAHFIIDSRYTKPNMLTYLEDILYGNATQTARLIMPSELISIYNSNGIITHRNLTLNPKYAVTSGSTELRRNLFTNPALAVDATGYSYWAGAGGAWTITRETAAGAPYGGAFYRMTCTTAPTSGSGPIIAGSAPYLSVTAGKAYVISAMYRSSTAGTIVSPQSQLYLDGTPTNAAPGTTSNTTYTTGAGTWIRMRFYTGVIPSGSNQLQVRFYVTGGTLPVVGTTVDLTNVLFEEADEDLGYFDGGYSALNYSNTTLAWTGTVGASASTMTGPSAPNAPIAYTAGGVVGWVAGNNTYRILAKKTTSGSIIAFIYTGYPSATPGDYYAGRVMMKQSAYVSDVVVAPQLYAYNSSGAGVGSAARAAATTLTSSTTYTDIPIPPIAACVANTAQIRWYFGVSGSIKAGTQIDMTNLLMEKVSDINGTANATYFDGDTPDANGYYYDWEGTPNASTSTITTWN